MREITYLEAVREAMSQEMRENEDVFILGEDIGVYGGAFGVTRGMIEEFGLNVCVIHQSVSQVSPALQSVLL